MVLLLITSCSNVENKMESMIPDNAVVVAKVDVPTLMGNLKVEFKDGKMVLPEKFAQMLEKNGMNLTKDSDKLMDSGIDFTSSLYFFMPDDKEPSMVALVPVSDPEKLKKFLSEEENATFEAKSGMEVASKAGMGYVINDGIMFVTQSGDPAATVSSLASLAKNMGDNKSMVRALDSSDDINVYINTKRLKELAGSELAGRSGNSDMARMLFDLMDIKSTALHLSLADGQWRIGVDNDVDENGDYAKLIQSVTTKPSAELLAYMPKAGNMGVLNFNINGEGILNLDMVKPLLAEVAGNPEMSQMIDIFKSVKGPVTLGVASSSLNPEEMDGALAFKCGKSRELVALVKQMFPGMYTQNGDECVLNEKMQGFDATLGIKGDVVYIKMTHNNYSDNMASVSDAKDVIGRAMCGGFLTLSVDNMQMQLTYDGRNIKQGSLTMWVKENGKKLSPLDALTFFEHFEDLQRKL